MRRLAFVVSVVGGLASQPTRADACSPPPCWPGYFVPATNSTVPANIPALYWQPLGGYGSTPDLDKLELSGSTGPAPTFTATADASAAAPSFVLSLGAPLVEGVTYALVDNHQCAYPGTDPPSATFQAGPPAALPTTLGTLAGSARELVSLQVATRSGSCDALVEASRQVITLELSSDALPWQDALHFETVVDGSSWRYYRSLGATLPPGSNSLGRGSDLVYAVCDADDPYAAEGGLAPGVHEVVMRATLPGTGLVLSTPPITVQLDCPDPSTPPDPPPPIEDGGCATSTPSLGVLVALLSLLGLRRRHV